MVSFDTLKCMDALCVVCFDTKVYGCSLCSVFYYFIVLDVLCVVCFDTL